ncbi:MAG: hypothetical protein AAFP82_14810, partial [Bacteroidota bacterium]
YSISIEIKGSLEEGREVLFDIDQYASWNSVLRLSENRDFVIGRKFKVNFEDSTGRRQAFKAKLIQKEEYAFIAQQNILFGWLLKATHHFILEEIDSETIQFTQHFEFDGLLGKLMRKQIIKSLSVFIEMNRDFKNHIENN